MSREVGWSLALLPSRSCVSGGQISADGCEVAAGRATYAKTDALLTTMTAGELASQLP
jgi:hypothetical protein